MSLNWWPCSISRFVVDIWPFNRKKWTIKILICENCIFLNLWNGDSKSENIIVFIFSLNLDSFWPRNDFIGNFDEIYYKKWSKSKLPFFWDTLYSFLTQDRILETYTPAMYSSSLSCLIIMEGVIQAWKGSIIKNGVILIVLIAWI